MNMAMSWQITQTKSHHQVHLQGTEIPIQTQDAVIDLHHAMIIKTDLTGQDPIPVVIDTEVTVVSNSHQVISQMHAQKYTAPQTLK